MNQSQVTDLQVKLSLEINDQTILKRIPAVQTFKELMQHATKQCPEQLRAEKIHLYYLDADQERIGVADDSDLQMAYALALSSDKKVKFHIELPKAALP
jgi:hypothetical protein